MILTRAECDPQKRFSAGLRFDHFKTMAAKTEAAAALEKKSPPFGFTFDVCREGFERARGVAQRKLERAIRGGRPSQLYLAYRLE